jgi:LacI family transcriptional regulator
MKSSNRKAATIYDIAKETGYTAATVSRALNDKGQVSVKVRELIINKAREMDYSPNPAAKSLKTRKTNQIMLSIPHMSNAFYFDMIDSIQSIARYNNYSLLLNYTQDSEIEEIRTLKKLSESLIDGLIIWLI